MDNPLRIINLRIENVKRLRAVEIEPDPNVVIIGGRNGQGKTSVLDSIEWALGGKPDKARTPKPVRDGESSAVVVVDLGELVVERCWIGTASTLTVRNADGAKVTSPQAILDALTGEMAFDPLQFSTQSPKVQRDTLLSLVELPFDLDALDANRKAVYDQRHDLNVELRAVEARIAALPRVDIPADAVSVSDAMDLYRAADTVAHSNRERRVTFHRATTVKEQTEQKLAEAEAALIVARSNAAAALATWTASKEVFDDIGPEPDMVAASEKLRDAEHWAEMRNEAKRGIELEDERARLAQESHDCTVFMEGLDAEKVAGLAAAVMPIEGLSFAADGGGITYQGQPFSQASAAEKLRVAVAIAMAGDPRIRIVRIADGSLLDEDNLALIAQLATDHDFQVWVERVGDADPTAIVIEDGSVLA